jgi:hypothetical protein
MGSRQNSHVGPRSGANTPRMGSRKNSYAPGNGPLGGAEKVLVESRRNSAEVDAPKEHDEV